MVPLSCMTRFGPAQRPVKSNFGATYSSARQTAFNAAVDPDLILLKSNPLQDVGNVSKRVGVMVNGSGSPKLNYGEAWSSYAITPDLAYRGLLAGGSVRVPFAQLTFDKFAGVRE